MTIPIKLSEQIPLNNTTPLPNSTLAVAKSSLPSEQGAAQEDSNFANSDLDELQAIKTDYAPSNASVLAKSSLDAQAGVAESGTAARGLQNPRTQNTQSDKQKQSKDCLNFSNASSALAKSSLPSEQGATQEDINFANSDLDEMQGFSQRVEGAHKEYVTDDEPEVTPQLAKDVSQKAKWVKICDYGDYNHTQGLQRLTFSSAQKMARKHHSLYSRLKRYFGGTPIYVGHPDDPAYRNQPGHSDTRAYAWVHRVEARADGLYILPRWSQAGKRLLSEAAYKYLSPRWKVAVLADGSFEPVELISIGLTNQPNIQGPAIANCAQATEALQAQTQENSTDALTQIAALMQLPIDASAASVVDALAERIDQINAAADAIEAQAEQPKTFMSNSLQDYTTTRANLRQKFVDEVHARMNQTGEDFSSAWSNIKATRREVFQKTTPVLV